MNRKSFFSLIYICLISLAFLLPLLGNHYFEKWYEQYQNEKLKELENDYNKQIAYVATEIGCLETLDTIQDFDNRQNLMANMGLPVYSRCN